jgi:GNAT superfamily N-acetyltransferase
LGQLTGDRRGAPPRFDPPEPIAIHHDLTAFDCGKTPPNDWLRHWALKSEARSARTYVVCVGASVAAYYCLATGGVTHDRLSGNLRRNMPDPVPMMVLGRLAVDLRYKRQGLGAGLLRDALQRTAAISMSAGCRALMVHAIDDDAKAFYLRYGFKEYPEGSSILFLPVETILKGL